MISVSLTLKPNAREYFPVKPMVFKTTKCIRHSHREFYPQSFLSLQFYVICVGADTEQHVKNKEAGNLMDMEVTKDLEKPIMINFIIVCISVAFKFHTLNYHFTGLNFINLFLSVMFYSKKHLLGHGYVNDTDTTFFQKSK